VDDVEFLAPFKFYRNQPRTVTIQAVFRPEGNAVLADCRLLGRRSLPNQAQPQVTIHFTGRVRLTKQPPVVTAPAPGSASRRDLGTPVGSIIQSLDIYRAYFHGPAYRVLHRAWRDGDPMVGEMTEPLPVNHYPPERRTVVAPRLIELCFQTAGLWEMGVQGRMGLPLHVHRARFLRAPELAEGRFYAVVTPDPGQGSFDAEVLDARGNRYVHLGAYRTVALPNRLDAELLRPLQSAIALEAVTA